MPTNLADYIYENVKQRLEMKAQGNDLTDFRTNIEIDDVTQLLVPDIRDRIIDFYEENGFRQSDRNWLNFFNRDTCKSVAFSYLPEKYRIKITVVTVGKDF